MTTITLEITEEILASLELDAASFSNEQRAAAVKWYELQNPCALWPRPR